MSNDESGNTRPWSSRGFDLERWVEVARGQDEARDSVTTPEMRERYASIGNNAANYYFAEALMWVSAHMQSGTDVTPGWLYNSAIGRYTDLQEQFEEEGQE
jgi:hypothetical protein